MKIANFRNQSKFVLLQDRYNRACEALQRVRELKKRKDLHLSDGGATPRGMHPLYSLHINDHEDGSGQLMRFDLTGLLMHFELLEFLEETLEHKILEIEKEVEAL